MKAISILPIFIPLFIGCSEGIQHQATSATFTVEDQTSGVHDESFSVELVEVETPAEPIAPLIFNVIEQYAVKVNESKSIEFQARQGDRYSYQLRIDPAGKEYDSQLVYDGNSYENILHCDLAKKDQNECRLVVEPVAEVKLQAYNETVGGQFKDSIWLELCDGYLCRRLSADNLGWSPEFGGRVPHGYYTMRSYIYRDGALNEELVEEFYLSHGQDTSIIVSY